MIDEPISKFMNRDVLYGDRDTPLREVIRAMNAGGHSSFIICHDGVPEGVITECDAVTVLDRALHGSSFDDICAADIMTAPIHTLPETSEMGEVVRVMNERRFRRVPIVDSDNQLSGIVNLMELQFAMNATLERRGRDLEVAVMKRTAELQAANTRLESLSVSDGLTGLLNRRAMADRLQEVHDLTRRYGNAYSIVLLDIDHFKTYNDTLGHVLGDDALKKVAQSLNEAVRTSDYVYRYGGEEFLVILSETVGERVTAAAERIRAGVEALAIPHPASTTCDVVTVSLGLVSVTRHNVEELPTWREAVELADRALYGAKNSGRNQLCHADDLD